MFTPFSLFSLGFNMALLAGEAQAVVNLRLARFAAGDFAAGQEAMRMVTEKAMAAGEANMRIATAAASGRLDHAPRAVVALYRKRVRANRRRLSR